MVDPLVLRWSDRFKVLRVHAVLLVAKMVKLEGVASRKLVHLTLISRAVSKKLDAVHIKASIAIGSDATCPNMTRSLVASIFLAPRMIIHWVSSLVEVALEGAAALRRGTPILLPGVTG